jgi:hypothetical protein
VTLVKGYSTNHRNRRRISLKNEEIKMKTKYLAASLVVLFLVHSTFAVGLYRSTRINMNAGMMHNMNAQISVSPIDGVNNSIEGSGAVGTLGFGTHIAGGFWGDFSIGFHTIKVGSEVNWYGETNEAFGLSPIMVGFRNYPLNELDTGFQPYLSMAGGPIIGVEARQKVGLVVVNETKTQTTMGFRVGGGVDMLIASWFGLELDAGYLFMNDFKGPINGHDSFNGWDTSIGITFFWGHQ